MAENGVGFVSLTLGSDAEPLTQILDLLAREGCDFYQGFLRSAGISSAELVALVLA